MSFNVRINLIGLSYKIIVASIEAIRSSFLRLPFLWGKKPSNKKRSVGKPDADNAVIDADAPGIASTLIFFSIAALISLYAGSLIPGVPASVTTATFFSEFKWFIIWGILVNLLCSK